MKKQQDFKNRKRSSPLLNVPRTLPAHPLGVGGYLNKENTFQRLLKEYQAYNSLVVAFDFDNTVYDYHQAGLDFSQMIKLLQDLKKIGCYLIIFTANEDEDFIKNYCNELKIPFDAINENPPFYKSKSRKIYYNILLDDRAGLREAFDHLTRLIPPTPKGEQCGGE